MSTVARVLTLASDAQHWLLTSHPWMSAHSQSVRYKQETESWFLCCQLTYNDKPSCQGIQSSVATGMERCRGPELHTNFWQIKWFENHRLWSFSLAWDSDGLIRPWVEAPKREWERKDKGRKASGVPSCAVIHDIVNNECSIITLSIIVMHHSCQNETEYGKKFALERYKELVSVSCKE